MAEITKKNTEKSTESKVVDAEKKEEVKEEEYIPTIEEEVLNNIMVIGRAVNTMEPRFTTRVMRTLTANRKKLNKESMRKILNEAYPKGSKTGQSLIANPIFDSLSSAPAASTEESMQVDSASTPAPTTEGEEKEKETPKASSKPKYTAPVDGQTEDLILEGTAYLRLLLILMNLDAGKVEEAAKFSDETAEILATANRRSMDQISAKVHFYLALAYERLGRLEELQSRFLAVRQTASLRKDETLESTALNVIVRSYILNNQYDQAATLMAKTGYQSETNQAQTVRWLYYLARVKAVQLDYAAANRYLSLCIRRAPKESVAPGFVQAIHKLYIVVELLTGVIPDRAMFRRPVLKNALAPYFQVVQAVRVGDMTTFQKTLTTYDATFNADDNHLLILRLRHFVLKTALRTITLAYSRISIRDICVKLKTDSEEETEYIVAKAIRDGVIEATIDHTGAFMQSRVARNVYETDEPQQQLTRRTTYLQNMYSETVKAMRYPPNAHLKELEAPADQRERDRELAQMMDEAEADDDDMEMDM